VAGCGHGAFGNAIYSPGGVLQGALFARLQTTGDCANPTPTTECRAAVCIRSQTYIGLMVACSAHLAGDKVAQATSYLQLAKAYTPARTLLWMAGDFNLTPGELPSAYGDTMTELVNNVTWDIRPENGGGPTKQFDHIFVPNGSGGVARTPYCADRTGSDHCWTEGEVHITF
jgi:endonuclease/exonuclease/phosphatase family metal-dependent hydrolase